MLLIPTYTIHRGLFAIALLVLLALFALSPPPAAGEPDRVLQRFYAESGDTLAACLRQVFAADSRRVPATLLDYEFRPALDFQRDRDRLSLLRRHRHDGRLIDGLSVPPPLGGERGTIVIVREFHPDFSEDGFLRTYVHELGNLLDYALHGDLDDARLMRHYGNPEDPSGDDDTGQRFERCVNTRGGFEFRPSLLARTGTEEE